MEKIPFYIHLVFIATTFISVWIFSRAAGYKKLPVIILSFWVLLQALFGVSGFYLNTRTTPPHFALALVPPLLLIAILFLLPAGRRFIDSLDLKSLTLLHVVRVPVELGLLGLFWHKAVPIGMTFEGHNFDILSGITAAVIYYVVFVKQWLGKTSLLIWNLICLGLLTNVVITAVLSAPLSFQQFAFDQPNIAILYFPFCSLPSCIVPLVLFAHLVAIRRLTRKRKEKFIIAGL